MTSGFESSEQAQIAEARGLNLGSNHYDLNAVGTLQTFVSCFVPIEADDMKIVNITQALRGCHKTLVTETQGAWAGKPGKRVLCANVFQDP